MRRTLIIALVAVAVLAGCKREEARPAGIAERWLQAVSDQGREAIRDDARERAAEYGDVAVAETLIAGTEEDERHFSDLEIGKAAVTGDTARVPFRVTARLPGDDSEDRAGTMVLQRFEGDWRVTEVVARGAGEEVPSEGGPRPARAAASQWLLALLVGVGITAASVALIEAQPRSALSR